MKQTLKIKLKTSTFIFKLEEDSIVFVDRNNSKRNWRKSYHDERSNELIDRRESWENVEIVTLYTNDLRLKKAISNNFLDYDGEFLLEVCGYIPEKDKSSYEIDFYGIDFGNEPRMLSDEEFNFTRIPINREWLEELTLDGESLL